MRPRPTPRKLFPTTSIPCAIFPSQLAAILVPSFSQIPNRFRPLGSVPALWCSAAARFEVLIGGT